MRKGSIIGLHRPVAMQSLTIVAYHKFMSRADPLKRKLTRARRSS